MTINKTLQKKQFKHGRIISSPHSVVPPTISLSTYGINSFHRSSANSTCYINHTAIQKSLPMHTSMAIVPKTVTSVFPLEWTYMTTPSLLNQMDPVSDATGILATVFCKHKYITNTTIAQADAIITATSNLSHNITSNTVATHLNDLQLADLTQIQKITQTTPTSIQNAIPTINTHILLP
jgi:hypothetical protein